MNPIEAISHSQRSLRSRLKGFPRKKVLVLEGGGMRGIFTVGVLQAFAERGYAPWHTIIGASAGALTGVVYAADQIHMARDAFFTELISGRFIRMSNIFRPEKHILNLDWLVDHITGGDEPLNIRKLRTTACPVLIAVTRFSQDFPPDTLYLSTKIDSVPQALKATAAIPFFYRGFVHYRNDLLLDGGVLDSVPFKKALSMGFSERDILVVVTRPKGYRKERDSFWIKTLYESYYKDSQYRYLVNSLEHHFGNYNRMLDDMETNYDFDIIYPPDDFKVNRLTRSEDKIVDGFEQGVAAAKAYLKPQS